MAAVKKEIRTQIDSVTLERHERLHARGDHARIAELAGITNNRMIGYYIRVNSAPVSLALVIKQYYEDKENLMQTLETPRK